MIKNLLSPNNGIYQLDSIYLIQNKQYSPLCIDLDINVHQ